MFPFTCFHSWYHVWATQGSAFPSGLSMPDCFGKANRYSRTPVIISSAINIKHKAGRGGDITPLSFIKTLSVVCEIMCVEELICKYRVEVLPVTEPLISSFGWCAWRSEWAGSHLADTKMSLLIDSRTIPPQQPWNLRATSVYLKLWVRFWLTHMRGTPLWERTAASDSTGGNVRNASVHWVNNSHFTCKLMKKVPLLIISDLLVTK